VQHLLGTGASKKGGVHNMTHEDVSTVLINGQVVMRNRQLLTIDEGATMAEVRAMAQQIAEAILA